MAHPLGKSGKHRVEQEKQGERGDAARGALLEDALHLLAKFVSKCARVCEEREAVETFHLRVPGRSLWARAASTWSASRRASALAVSRPSAVIA